MRTVGLLIITILIGFSLSLEAQSLPQKTRPEAEVKPRAKLPALTKSPRSLFLVKKAKIDNDVGEPVLYPSEKQAELLINEKIYNKYRLQILDTHGADWNSTR